MGNATIQFVELIEARTKDGKTITDEMCNSELNNSCINSHTSFYLVFDDQYFFEGEYLCDFSNSFDIRICGDPIYKDDKFIYEVESSRPILFSAIKAGTKLKRDLHFVEKELPYKPTKARFRIANYNITQEQFDNWYESQLTKMILNSLEQYNKILDKDKSFPKITIDFVQPCQYQNMSTKEVLSEYSPAIIIFTVQKMSK